MDAPETDGTTKVVLPTLRCRPRRPILAALLAPFGPGLGQLYCGEWRRALVVFLASLGLIASLLLTGALKHFAGLVAFLAATLIFLVWLIWDSVRLARTRRHYALRWFNRWYIYLLLVFAIGHFSPAQVLLTQVKAYRIVSGGMEPTLRLGDSVMADTTYYDRRPPARGDLALFVPPTRSEAILVKRIIALENDQIAIENKVVYVNGERLDDSWVQRINPRVIDRRDNLGPVRVPQGHVFVLGDSRDHSLDSRFFGPVSNSSLRGRPLYIYWAADKARIGIALH